MKRVREEITASKQVFFATTVLFVLFLFSFSTMAAIFLYRLLPLPSILKPTSGAVYPETIFINTLARTPLNRNRNLVRLPLAIGFALLRRLIPPLNNFFERRLNNGESQEEISVDAPHIADMNIPGFQIPSAHETAGSKWRVSYCNTLSALIFLILFLICLSVISSLVGFGVKLFASSARTAIDTTREVEKQLKQLPIKSKTNNETLDVSTWLDKANNE